MHPPLAGSLKVSEKGGVPASAASRSRSTRSSGPSCSTWPTTSAHGRFHVFRGDVSSAAGRASAQGGGALHARRYRRDRSAPTQGGRSFVSRDRHATLWPRPPALRTGVVCVRDMRSWTTRARAASKARSPRCRLGSPRCSLPSPSCSTWSRISRSRSTAIGRAASATSTTRWGCPVRRHHLDLLVRRTLPRRARAHVSGLAHLPLHRRGAVDARRSGLPALIRATSSPGNCHCVSRSS